MFRVMVYPINGGAPVVYEYVDDLPWTDTGGLHIHYKHKTEHWPANSVLRWIVEQM